MLKLRQQHQNHIGLPCNQKWFVIRNFVGGNSKGHQEARCKKAAQRMGHIRLVSSRQAKEARIGSWHGKCKEAAHKKPYQDHCQGRHPELIRIHQDFTEQHVVNTPCQQRVDHKGSTCCANKAPIGLTFNLYSIWSIWHG